MQAAHVLQQSSEEPWPKGLFLTIAWPSLHIYQIGELQNSSRTLLDPSISKVDEAASCMTNDAVLLFYDRALSRCTASIYITCSSVDRNSISITITSEGQGVIGSMNDRPSYSIKDRMEPICVWCDDVFTQHVTRPYYGSYERWYMSA